jgi:signal transduction histidine kinase
MKTPRRNTGKVRKVTTAPRGRGSSAVNMRRELDRRTRELVEAREQQAASSEVLDIISSSPGELKRVFQSILANAIRLCGARFGNLFLHNDGVFRAVAQHNAPRLYAAALRRPIHIRDNPRVPLARIAVTKQPVHISNLAREQAYIDRDPRMLLLVDVARARTLLVVPMLKQEELIGAIGLYRPIVRPFSEKQIALIKIFANQAAIAIQNTRLVNELRERTDQLQLANLAKSRFLAVASHDLRQPLHALGLFVAQLRSNADSTERSRIIAQINAAVTAMNELFNALLDISKLDADVLKPNVTRFPIQHVFTRLKTTFADAAHEKALKLRVVPSNAWVYSDLILLERIMLNLASNGVRYTVRGGVVVGARRRGNVLRLEVWDSGPGIPEDQRKNIFGEFYQIASAQGSHAAGLGLGLAIVERLCGLLDHRLEMTSVVGRGSRFAILVPLTSAGTELVDHRLQFTRSTTPAKASSSWSSTMIQWF